MKNYQIVFVAFVIPKKKIFAVHSIQILPVQKCFFYGGCGRVVNYLIRDFQCLKLFKNLGMFGVYHVAI
jgi:hypothetical protein